MTTLERELELERELNLNTTADAPSPTHTYETLTRPQLRIATAGSVDDGKSTLIGRLLHDTKTIFEDQLDAVARASRRYGDQELNLALLTDGLRAEREQGITIDVAYRYFATPKRSFVLADTPGHAQYTRNMVTGASIADVAIVLIDARLGVLEQTRRHLGISSLLGVRHLVVAVNKMDLVDWNETVFATIVENVRALLSDLDSAADLHALPVSALHGDNIVTPSDNAPWYGGPTLLSLLEHTNTFDDAIVGGRVSVQWVLRAGSDYRGYAGNLAGGPLHVGDEVTVLPSGRSSTVESIARGGVSVRFALPGDAVAVTLADHIDVGRGDMLVATGAPVNPSVTSEFHADVCAMADEGISVGQRFVVKHLSRSVGARVSAIRSRRDPETLAPVPATFLALNDLGEITLTLDESLAVDRYLESRSTGRFILIDERTNATAAAGTVRATN
jgi:sulfate adenylyltransferase large subunit